MRLLKKSVLFMLLTASVIVFTSATPAPANKVIDPKKVEAVIKDATADGKVTNKELAQIATTVKGEKLSLKEKIALKIFGKKISSKLTSEGKFAGGKSQVIALILCALVGGLGIHRFYLGYTWQGIVQLLTLGGCGIWSLIDLIRIITGSLQPKDGEYETTL